MISKPHRTNSDFQIRHFLAGSCHTADGAWALLYSERIALEDKLRHSEAQRLRREAKIAKARHKLKSVVDYDVLEARADIVEAEADLGTWFMNVEAAKAELATIVALMAEIEPHRKYAHLPFLKANEAAQQEEWKLELMYRAENFLMTSGTIPHDHFARMREHPQFHTDILPHVTECRLQIRNGKTDFLIEDKSKTLGLPCIRTKP